MWRSGSVGSPLDELVRLWLPLVTKAPPNTRPSASDAPVINRNPSGKNGKTAMLAFCNHLREDVWLAYMFFSPEDCGGEGGNFQAIGWFHIPPGACTTVYANDLDDVNNRFWFFHAFNRSRSIVWSGPFQVGVTDAPFNHCITLRNTTQQLVGFQVFDVGDNDDFTMNLFPPFPSIFTFIQSRFC